MDDEDLIEEIGDNIEEQPSSFSNRTLTGNKSTNVPNVLKKRALNKSENNNTNKSLRNNKKNAPIGKKSVPNLTNGENSNNSLIANKLKRKNKPLSFLNRRKKEDNEDSDSNNQNGTNDNDQASLEDVVVKAKRIILIAKIGLIIGVIAAIFAIIVAIVSFFASILGISDDFSKLGSTSNIDINAEYYKEAVLYHENLNKATSKYADSCGVYLDRSYIHATLSYLWTISDTKYSEKERYQIMADNVDEVADLMVLNCVVDYQINGSFYNKLKDSNFLKKYYKNALSYIDAESITTGIFEYAELGIDLIKMNSGFISDKLKVTMGTCEQPYNKKLLNEGSNYSSTIGFSDYVMGVVMGEVEGSIKRENMEFLKAFTIVASSYALSRGDYQSGNEEIWVHNGNCWQLSCDIHEGCTYCKDLGTFGTTLTGMNRTCNNLGYRKNPMSTDQRNILDEAFKEVFGTVMLEVDGKIFRPSYRDTSKTCGTNVGCLGQEDAIQDAKNGMSYKEILEKYYDNFTLSNMLEDSYVGDVNYDSGGYNGSVVYYDQTDYNQSFCGLKRTIKTDGCGVTSMAMVLSTFIDKSYTPPVVMQEAYSGDYCGGSKSGTSIYFFKYSAQKHGLGYSSVGKAGDKQQVIDALKSGKSLVIAHMGPGTFTNGGHYIVLTKINDKGQAYVLDSNNSRRTGWHDFNEVLTKQLKSYGSFHIITKR